MPTLADQLLAPHHRDEFVADCVKLVETQVSRLSGLRGMSLRTGLAMLKSARPDVLPRAVARLLPEFVQALEPLYQKFRCSTAGDFKAFMQRHAADAIDALLAVTDTRMGASQNAVAKSFYARFRHSAEAELEQALPALAGLMRIYLS
ncbi:MAG: hypothetical protein HYV18_09280 [Gammaproteobacteria bacterium]|nr:hypothetical protein [Gammaproteobacteria bacterium]